MHVKYFYPWGYFYPVTYGCDRAPANHLEYFRARGWTVEVIVTDIPGKRNWADNFRDRYSWLRALHVVPHYQCESQLRDMLYAHERLAESPRLRAALAGPADLFFTNYVFTSPLLQHVPASCKRVLESHDILTRQFDMAERLWRGVDEPIPDPVAEARSRFLLRMELELYELYDTVVMVNDDERRFVASLGIPNALYVPQMYQSATAPGSPRPHKEHQFDLIFVGSDVIPNVRGMTWFYRHVYVPYLWRHKVRLALVGSVCNALDVHDEYVTRFSWVNGPLDDLYASAKVTVVPIFEGTGLSIKTLEGLALGRAMVVTPVGARGLDDQANAYRKIDMKADPQRTAALILDLLANPAQRGQLEHAAAAYVRRCFSRDAFFAAMDRVIESVGLDPATARNGVEKTSRAKAARIHSSWPIAPVRSS